jgi:two-component system chemotaxis response regulator CheB
MAEPRDIVVIGGSAGAIEALISLVVMLPAELDAAIFVVVHTLPVGESRLPEILSRRGPLRAAVAIDGEPIACGRIYVAAPDAHLLIEPGRVRLRMGPKESGHRPAIDPLFHTAASAYRSRVVGVILSGMLDDGSAGLREIRRYGGSAIVQDPKEALFPQMPNNAIEIGTPQHVAPVAEIARLIVSHVGRPTQEAATYNVAPNGDQAVVGAGDTPGTPSGIACPECHGVLWTAPDKVPEFSCRVGHAYSLEALIDAHTVSLEASLWAGVRALREQASLANHIARRAERRGDRRVAARYESRAGSADEHAGKLETMLLARMENPRPTRVPTTSA